MRTKWTSPSPDLGVAEEDDRHLHSTGPPTITCGEFVGSTSDEVWKVVAVVAIQAGSDGRDIGVLVQTEALIVGTISADHAVLVGRHRVHELECRHNQS